MNSRYATQRSGGAGWSPAALRVFRESRVPARTQWAFTLVELLIVIVILGILAALILPAIRKSQETGRSAACLSNLHQIGIALQLYVQDNQNSLPIMYDKSLVLDIGTNQPTVDVVLSNQIEVTQILLCPSDLKNVFKTTGSSYSWNSALNGQDADHLQLIGITDLPHQIPVMYDKEKFHIVRGDRRAINYLFADGHLKNTLEIQVTK